MVPAMSEDERVTLEVLTAIREREPISSDSLVHELKQRLPSAGITEAHKVDKVLVARLLAELERAKPRLVVGEFPPNEVDPIGRPLPGAAEQFTLTVDGALERDRLARLAGRMAD
jgi:hypothetical protein